MKKTLYILIILLLPISCKKIGETPVSKPIKFDRVAYKEDLKIPIEPVIAKKSKPKTSAKTPANDSIPKTQPTEIIKKDFPADTIKFAINYGKAKIDTLKKPGQTLIFEFDSDYATYFKVDLESGDSLANLRINQIIDAEGNASGPFPASYDYRILNPGKHKVSVNENIMSGGQWGGKFSFNVRLSWKKPPKENEE